MTYTLIGNKYEDNEFLQETGLTREQLVNRIAELKAVTSRYERWDDILFFQEPAEYDYTIEAEAAALVAVKRKAAGREEG